MFRNNYEKLICKDTSKTQQHFREQTNINSIIAKYRRTGFLPVMQQGQPMFGDFSSGKTYHEMVNQVKTAQESFEQLPAEFKKKFEQDPAKMIDFVLNAENNQVALEMGLISPTIEESTGEGLDPDNAPPVNSGGSQAPSGAERVDDTQNTNPNPNPKPKKSR